MSATVTALNGTLSTATSGSGLYEISWTTTFCSGLYLYIYYVKGTETSLDLAFKAIDNNSKILTNQFYITKLNSATLVVEKFICKLDGTIPRLIVPVPTPEAGDSIVVQFQFVGTPSGTLTVFGETDNKYKSI